MNREEAELARLLQLARQADLPDAARLARVRARFLPPSAASVSQPSAAAGAKLGVLGAKIFAGMAAVGLAVWAYQPHGPVAPPARITPPPPAVMPAAPTPAALPAAAASTEPAIEPAEPAPAPPPEPRRVRKRAKQQPAAVPAPTLSEQAAMLQMATLAMRAGQLERASETLAEFARRYPDSQLTPDRVKLEQRLQQLRSPQQ